MRSFKEIASFLITREQLALGWRLTFFIVCGALLYGSLTLSRIRIYAVEVQGTVVKQSVDGKQENPGNYAFVQLDNGETVQARVPHKHDFRPGQRVILKATMANFFSIRKYEIKGDAAESGR
jgi:hypothetical protein